MRPPFRALVHKHEKNVTTNHNKMKKTQRQNRTPARNNARTLQNTKSCGLTPKQSEDTVTTPAFTQTTELNRLPENFWCRSPSPRNPLSLSASATAPRMSQGCGASEDQLESKPQCAHVCDNLRVDTTRRELQQHFGRGHSQEHKQWQWQGSGNDNHYDYEHENDSAYDTDHGKIQGTMISELSPMKNEHDTLDEQRGARTRTMTFRGAVHLAKSGRTTSTRCQSLKAETEESNYTLDLRD